MIIGFLSKQYKLIHEIHQILILTQMGKTSDQTSLLTNAPEPLLLTHNTYR